MQIRMTPYQVPNARAQRKLQSVTGAMVYLVAHHCRISMARLTKSANVSQSAAANWLAGSRHASLGPLRRIAKVAKLPSHLEAAIMMSARFDVSDSEVVKMAQAQVAEGIPTTVEQFDKALAKWVIDNAKPE